MTLNNTTIAALDRLEDTILAKYDYIGCSSIQDLIEVLADMGKVDQVNAIWAARDEVVNTLNN